MQSAAILDPEVRQAQARPTGVACYPLLGLGGAIAGTIVAVVLAPADPGPKGALFFPALAMVTGLAAAPVAAALRDPKSILRGVHLLALAPIYWLLLDLVQGSYSMGTISRDEVDLAFCGIGTFVVAVWISALFRGWKVPNAITTTVAVEFSRDRYFALLAVAFILGMLKYAIACGFDPVAMFYYVGQMRWDAPWVRGSLGGWDAFLDHLQYFGYLVPALTVIVARRAGWRNWRTVIGVAMTMVMALFLAQNGGRRIIGVVFGMAIILAILTQKKLRPKHFLAVAFAVVAVLGMMEVMLEYRDVGLSAITEQEYPSSQTERSDLIRVDDNFYRLCQIIDFIPQSYPFVYQKYLIYVLVRPIPRVFWPGKPEDPGFDLPTALGDKNVNYTSSVVGELYMSGGFFAIALGGLLYGRFSRMADQLLTESTTLSGFLVYSAMVMALFAGMRSMVELVLMNYVVLAWVSLSFLYRRIKGIKKKTGRLPRSRTSGLGIAS